MKKINIAGIAIASALAGGLAGNMAHIDHTGGTYGVSIGTDTRYCSIEAKLPVFTCEAVVDNTTVRVPVETMSYYNITHHRMPKWVHWQRASKDAAREVCGKNVPAIIAWGGNGDTSVLICKNGKAETS